MCCCSSCMTLGCTWREKTRPKNNPWILVFSHPSIKLHNLCCKLRLSRKEKVCKVCCSNICSTHRVPNLGICHCKRLKAFFSFSSRCAPPPPSYGDSSWINVCVVAQRTLYCTLPAEPVTLADVFPPFMMETDTKRRDRVSG